MPHLHWGQGGACRELQGLMVQLRVSASPACCYTPFPFLPVRCRGEARPHPHPHTPPFLSHTPTLPLKSVFLTSHYLTPPILYHAGPTLTGVDAAAAKKAAGQHQGKMQQLLRLLAAGGMDGAQLAARRHELPVQLLASTGTPAAASAVGVVQEEEELEHAVKALVQDFGRGVELPPPDPAVIFAFVTLPGDVMGFAVKGEEPAHLCQLGWGPCFGWCIEISSHSAVTACVQWLPQQIERNLCSQRILHQTRFWKVCIIKGGASPHGKCC